MTDTALISIRTARVALASAADRSAALIRSVGDMDLRLPDSEWTVGDTAAHLIFALRGFTASAAENDAEWLDVAERLPPTSATFERVAAVNRVLIAAEPERSPDAAAKAIINGVDAFLTVTATLAPSQVIRTPWYGEAESLAVADATALLLGEQVLHGYDIARAAGRKWPIAKSDAHLIAQAVQTMMPKMAKPEALGNLVATYRFHLGGEGGFVVRCARGTITVEPTGSQRIDCHVAADPASFLLLGYGRTNQWRPIARGKMITLGRKPWLAFRFAGFLTHP
jgi:uncharacterized protein (TIGR03083 family)